MDSLCCFKKYGTVERLLLDIIFSLICCLCMTLLLLHYHMIINFINNSSLMLKDLQNKKFNYNKAKQRKEHFMTQNLSQIT